jgi:hypothetical protein
MPEIYQGRCAACEAVTPMTSGFYRAVFLDEPSTSPHAHPDEPRLVILGHPIEDLVLKEVGFTSPSASLGGRLVYVEQLFCRSCGRLFEVRRLTAGVVSSLGCGGCLVCLGLCIAAGVAVGLQVGGSLGFTVGYAVTVLLLRAADWLLGAGVRRWYRERARLVETPCRCPTCGSGATVSPGGTWDPLPCVACGQPAVQVRSVGIS